MPWKEGEVQESVVRRAVAAAKSVAASLGLPADDATVLHNSNTLALRLRPCEVFARVARGGRETAVFEVELAQRLAETGAPVAALEPRVEPGVFERDGFTITLWTYYEPLAEAVTPAEYAHALGRLHHGMRSIRVTTPHFTDRVAEAERLVASRELTPSLGEPDRELLGEALANLSHAISDRGPREQVLHGEPHPGNLLATAAGPLFIDLETCCRGPVEFDLAHVPDEVSARYAGMDEDLLRQCRILVLGMITTWRFDRDDELPSGRKLGAAWLSQLRTELASPA